MPGISFIGTKPREEDETAKMIKGISGVAQAMYGLTGGKTTEENMVERGMEVREGELQYKLDNLDQSKKMDAISMITKVLNTLPDEAKQEVLNKSEIRALYESAGVPIPTVEEEELPLESWKDVSVIGRVQAALTPTRTKEEKQLGALRPGGIFKAPKKWPKGTTEEDIQATMKKHGLTRRELLDKIGI